MNMIHLPALRWGEPYESLDTVQTVHFDTGEPVATVSQVLPAMVRRDPQARPTSPIRPTL